MNNRPALLRVMLGGALLCLSCRHQTEAERAKPELARGVEYRHVTLTEPRPLHVHILEVDLTQAGLVLEARIADDPDGDGPAEAELLKPLVLAAHATAIAAVNANAFGALPDENGNRENRWRAGMPVEICGWARHAGVDRSTAHDRYGNFWTDETGRAHVGAMIKADGAVEAVGGFNIVIKDGSIVGRPDNTLHPRTAVGVDKEGRRVWLVVVDGRQKGYSEGMSCYELAELMQGMGCWNALNLDGGGSSVMMLRQSDGQLAVVNRVSGGTTRPVPVMIVLREREHAGGQESVKSR